MGRDYYRIMDELDKWSEKVLKKFIEKVYKIRVNIHQIMTDLQVYNLTQ